MNQPKYEKYRKTTKNNLIRTNSEKIISKTVSETHDKLKTYYQFMKEQRNFERMKSKQQKYRLTEIQQKLRKKQLKEELKQKKQQLHQLYNKDLISKDQVKAFEKAAIKEKQLSQKRKQKQQLTHQNEEISKNRYKNAKKWMEIEKSNLNFLKNQAQYRRKTSKEWHSMERTKTIKYNQSKEKVKQIENMKNPPKTQKFDQFKQTLGKKAYKMIYYKENQHSLPNQPLIQRQNQQEQINNVEKATQMIEIKKKNKQNQKQLNRRKSEERGKSAQNRIKLKQQQTQFIHECQKKAIQYNMKKLAIGKVNQYVGIKPQTLNQIKTNKQLRSQIQFQKMFLKPCGIQKNNLKANLYDIIEKRKSQQLLTNNRNSKNRQSDNQIKQNYESSVNPNFSQGKYSFQSQKIDTL